ncbi:crotonase/enoyl-CoA hydratase family protein [Flocculibacter collagenilyticus]|uniref:crotonase/enoyl-CoA hydratase family protein n=1 Tax=Flocculibacter collagenilyticus TaxID=2744479 RepID=UPI0018F608D3|nr:crotonase/enoyl-CoA hydratase family protein [Flocculibacter collagenilyticus]
MNTRVKLNINQGVATVTLTRPEAKNALDMAMFTEIDRTIKQLKTDRSLRAVILCAEGEDFSTGIDVKSIMGSAKNAIKLLYKWLPWQANLAQRVCVGWRDIPVPVIALIQGRCWGGALQIALGADFRIATPNAQLAILETRWGLIPDMGGNLVLRELLTKDQAMKLAMTGQEVTAAQALEMQLISQVSDNPLQDAEQLIAQISSRSPDAIAAIKKLYHSTWSKPDKHFLSKETLYQIKVLMGKNQRQAVSKQTKKPDLQYSERQRW